MSVYFHDEEGCPCCGKELMEGSCLECGETYIQAHRIGNYETIRKKIEQQAKDVYLKTQRKNRRKTMKSNKTFIGRKFVSDEEWDSKQE